jgi:hypothetical protein
MLIVGSSGCGKNVLLMKMLLKDGFIDYNNLIMYSTTIDQIELQILKEGFENGLTKKAIENIFDNQDRFPEDMDTPEKIVEFYKTNIKRIPNAHEYLNEENKINITLTKKSEEMIPCDSLPKDKKNLVIFDDVVNLKNQNIMKSYFTRGRHNNCNVIYISQNYYSLDKDSIRNNSNCFVFFKLQKKDKDLIYNDLFSNIIEKDEFDLMSRNHWYTKYNYIYLNRDEEEIKKDLGL